MRVFIFSIFVMSANILFGQAFIIKGHIEGLNGKILLAPRSATRSGIFDTTEAMNGNFEFHGQVPETDIYKLQIVGDKKFRAFYLYNGCNLLVDGDANNIYYSTVDGSDENKIRDEWIEGRRSNPENAMEFDLDFVKSHLNNFVCLEILSVYSGFAGINGDSKYVELTKELLNIIPEKFHNNTIYTVALSKLMGKENLVIGAKAPDFSQPDISGNMVSLHQFKGKYVFVDFWAHWCGPCRQEHPAYKEIYNQYRNKSFEFISISLDRENEKQEWLDAIKKDGLTWTQLSDLKGVQNDAAKKFGVDGTLPRSFLIDPNGIIVAIDLRGEGLKNYLDKNL